MTEANGSFACLNMEYYPYGQEQPNSTTIYNITHRFTGYERDAETWVNGTGLDSTRAAGDTAEQLKIKATQKAKHCRLKG